MKNLLAKLGVVDMASFRGFAGQFLKFGIVGVSNTAVSLGVYYVLTLAGLHYILSHVVAFAVSVLNAFYWNRKYVFKSAGEGKSRQLLKIYIAYGVTFALGTGLLFLMVDILGVSELVAPLLNLCVTVPLNFLLNKFWVFRVQ